jgi:hypothetical protein
MKHVGPFFAYDGEGLRTLAEINGTLVSAFTKRKVHERELLADSPTRLRSSTTTP